MSQLVTASDGTVHVFPDEASPAQIAQALGVQLGPTRDAIIAHAAQASGLDPRLLKGLIATESHGNDSAVGIDPKTGKPTGAQGETQIGPTLRKQYGVTDPSDYTQTIPATAQIIADRLSANGGDINDALKYYHGGPNQKIWGPLTNAYPAQVLKAGGLTPDQAVVPKPTALSVAEMNAGPKETAARFGPQSADIQAQIQSANTDSLRPTDNYGFVNELANGVMLGQGPKVLSALQRFGPGNGPQLTAAPGGGYNYPTSQQVQASEAQNASYGDAQQAAAEGERAAYLKAHPVLGAVADIAGSTPTTMGALGLAGRAIAPALDAVRTLSPEIESGVNFLTGNSGNFGRGVGQTATALGSAASRGAAEGGAAGLLQSGLNEPNALDQTKTGGLVGAFANPLLSAVTHAVVPWSTEVAPGVAAATKELVDRGVEVRGGQVSMDPKVRAMDAKLNGDNSTTQLGQFTSAVRKTLGLPEGTSLLPADVQKADNAIGQKFEAVRLDPNLQVPFAGTPAKGTAAAVPGFQDKLNDLYTKISGLPLDESKLAQAKKLYDKVTESGIVGGGNINGEEYLALTQRGGPIDTLIRDKDPQLKLYAGKIRNALDDALMQGAQASNNPGLVSKLKEAREQYKNLLTVEPMVEGNPSGTLDPTKLSARVGSMFGDYGFSPDAAGDLGRLAEGGKLLPKPAITGEAKPLPGQNAKGPFERFAHSPLGFGAGALGVYELAKEGLEPLANIAAQHPLAASGAALAGLGGLGGRQIVRSYQRSVMQSPEYLNYLLQNATNPAARRVGNNRLLPGIVEGVNSQR